MTPVEPDTGALRASDLPAPDADEHALHEFALTLDGYTAAGSFARAAAVANGAIERWRRSGELPTQLDELRTCLFFESRRWRHFGEGFDEETRRYAWALVDAMRPLVAGKRGGK